MTMRLVAGVIGAASFLVGVSVAIPLAWREILEAQGNCDYVSCVSASTAQTLVALSLLATLGIALMRFGARGLVRRRLTVIIASRLFAVIGSLIAVASATAGVIAGYDHPIEVAGPAIVFAIGACSAAFAPRVPAGLAGPMTMIAGLIGFVVMLQWGVNTTYYVAVPFWLLGGGLLASEGLWVSPQRSAIVSRFLN